MENACTFDADDAWLLAVFFCLFVCLFVCLFAFLFLFLICIAAQIILLARFNSCVINTYFVKLYDAIIFYYGSL